MKRINGANHDLASLIDTHLFIISPNNSGSNLLRSALARSRATWNLDREGQHISGFCGPSTRGSGARLIWASNPKWLKLFSYAKAYDWPHTRDAWYSEAFGQSDRAHVFVTSSPPFLLNVGDLKRSFHNPKFIFMVRNPYAVIEGICRRASQQIVADGEDIRILAAQHVVTCLRFQKENIAGNLDGGVHISYEYLCANPVETAARIEHLVPGLGDLDFEGKLPVKGMYNEPLRNMNDEQIARLDRADIELINTVLGGQQDLLEYFHYELIA